MCQLNYFNNNISMTAILISLCVKATIFRLSSIQSCHRINEQALRACFWLVPAKLWQQINEAYAPADSLAVCSWWEQPSFAENTSAWLPLIGTHTLTLSLCPLSEAVSSYNQRCPAHIFLGQAVRRGKHQKFAAKFDNLLLSRRGI